MDEFTYNGRRFIRVAALSETGAPEDDCVGCAFHNGKATRTPRCKALKNALGSNQYCGSDIWIPDTPAGKAKYVTQTLES